MHNWCLCKVTWKRALGDNVINTLRYKVYMVFGHVHFGVRQVRFEVRHVRLVHHVIFEIHKNNKKQHFPSPLKVV